MGQLCVGSGHALKGHVPDEGVIVIAQVDAVGTDGIIRLRGVDDRGVFVKVQAILQAIAQDLTRCDTIVVASTQDEAAALQALGNATQICVIHLANT